MKPSDRPAAGKQAESIEFVPKRDLDQSHQENERLRKENDRLRTPFCIRCQEAADRGDEGVLESAEPTFLDAA